MINRLSVNWTDFLVRNHVIHSQKKEIYLYGMELLLSTALNFGFMVLNSVFVVQMPLAFISYTVVYIPFRLTAGGYHAKTHHLCILYTQGTFVLSILLMKYMIGFIAQFVLPLTAISLLIIWYFAPVEAKNKPLSNKEFIKAKQRSHKLVFLFGLLTVVYFYMDKLHLGFVLTGIAACVSVAFSLLTEYIFEKIQK